MTSNTKQSEDTYIQWSVNMNNAIQVGQLNPEPILTIHPDGRVTTSPRLKPDEISALVLDQIKTQWMKDAQASKIRELNDRIKRLEESGDKLEYASVISEAGEDPNGFEKLLIAQREWREARGEAKQ